MPNKNFSKSEKYPNPAESFAFKLTSKENALKTCLFVLDANVLILPYTADAQSLEEIRKVYSRLVKEERLFIPAQSAREYLDNRSLKLSDAHELLYKKQTQNFQFIKSHPFLNELNEFKTVINTENELKQLLKRYSKEISSTLNTIKSWEWNDPVSEMYHQVLPNAVLDDSHINHEALNQDLKRRQELKIPPGYKDGGKNENQAGDLLIWYEILALAEKTKNHIVFVSGDEKADWWHQSGGNALYPRFELVDEFRSRSGGNSFHIISLSDLLKAFDANTDVIEAVEAVEAAEVADNHDKYSFRMTMHPELDYGINKAKNIIKTLHQLLNDYNINLAMLQRNQTLKLENNLFSPHEHFKLQRNNDTVTARLIEHYNEHRLDIIHCVNIFAHHNPYFMHSNIESLIWQAKEPGEIQIALDEFEKLVEKQSILY